MFSNSIKSKHINTMFGLCFVMFFCASLSTSLHAEIILTPCHCNEQAQIIEEAINNANNQGKVTLAPSGNDKIFTVNRTINIRKEGFDFSGADGAMLQATLSFIGDPMLILHKNNTTISSLTIDGSNSATIGIYAHERESINISNNIIKNFVHAKRSTNAAIGIRLDDVIGGEIVSNKISGMSGAGDEEYNFPGSNRGILLYHSKGIKIHDNDISDVRDVNDADCIQADTEMNSYEVDPIEDRIHIYGNRFYNCYKRALKLAPGGNILAENNLIYADHDVLMGTGIMAGQGNIVRGNTIHLKYAQSGISQDSQDKSKSGSLENPYVTGRYGSRIENNFIDIYGEEVRTPETRGFYLANNETVLENYKTTFIDNTILSANYGIWKHANRQRVEVGGNQFLTRYLAKMLDWSPTPYPTLSDLEVDNIDLSSEYKAYYRFNHYHQSPYEFVTGATVAQRIPRDQNASFYTGGHLGWSLYFNHPTTMLDFKNDQKMVLTKNTTLMFWVRSSVEVGSAQHPHYPGLFSAYPNGGWDNYISLREYGNEVSLMIEDSDGQLIPSLSFPYTRDQWLHIAISVDNNSHTTFYFDGEMRGKSTQQLSRVDLKYLNRGYAGSPNFGGQNAHYDEIKLIGKALTQEEITEHHKREDRVREYYGWN